MTSRLRVEKVCKAYAAPVLRDVSLTIGEGEIHALLGANGAGKSTLSRIIAGLVMPTSGTMSIDGRLFAPKNKFHAEQQSVQIVQQELNIVPTLSVAENIYLNRLPHRLGFVSRPKLDRLAHAALESVGLSDIDPQRPAGSLGVGVCQLVEIASALSRQCRILILDEPTAALTASETSRLFERLQAMKAQGVSVIYITHRLEEVVSVCDRLTVLRDGCVVGSASVAQTSASQMVTMMTGEEPTQTHEFRSYRQTEVAMRVERLSRFPVFQDVSFEVRRGECLGIAGLVGSGRTELLRSIFGADPADHGTVSLPLAGGMVAHRFSHPKQSVCLAMAMVTEERKHDGLLLAQPTFVNLSLATLRRFSRMGLLRRRAERDGCALMSEKLAIKCDSIDQPARELSGGNQQKIVLGKWLLGNTKILLLDEPTRGIDVGARQRIYHIIAEQAAAGVAIVIVSSDLQELMDHCDAIAVMAGGRLVAKFERASWSAADITAACFKNPTLPHRSERP